MKPSAPATHPQAVPRPNGVHAFQKLSNDRQRAEIAEGIADLEQRFAAYADLLQKLG